jgi:hypothetical protein
MQRTKTIDVAVPHRLTRDEARRRLRDGSAKLQAQLAGSSTPVAQVSEAWDEYHNEFRFTAMGQSITGRMDVEADCVRLAVDLPWMLALIADSLRGRVEQETRKLLEKK